MADFPNNVYNPATKSNGQTIQAAWYNDPDAEIRAIEDGYLNGTARLNSSNSTVASLSVTGGSTFAGAVTFSGAVTGLSLGYPADGRLTLTTATPVTTSDVTGATTLYYAPFKGNTIGLYTGSAWVVRTFAELSIAVPATTATMYDVFVYDNAGTAALELTAWTNDTTRATALTTQDGVLVKTGALTRRYLGLFRTTGVSGQTEDSLTKRFVWNYYNRTPRVLRKIDTSVGSYNSATIRQLDGDTANKIEVVVGVAEVPISLQTMAAVTGGTDSANLRVGIGEDSTSTFSSNQIGGAYHNGTGASLGAYWTVVARLDAFPAVGYHFYSINEAISAGTMNYLDSANGENTGISGAIQG